MNNAAIPGSGLTASGYRSLAWVGGALASLAASVVAAILAVVFTASLVVIVLMAAALAAFALLAARARRALRSPRPARTTLKSSRPTTSAATPGWLTDGISGSRYGPPLVLRGLLSPMSAVWRCRLGCFQPWADIHRSARRQSLDHEPVNKRSNGVMDCRPVFSGHAC